MSRARRTAALLLSTALLSSLLVVSRPVPCRAGAEEEQQKSLEDYEPLVDAAIDRALEYLAAQQTDEGWWPGKSQFAEGNTAITSLCVMAFLARGHTPGVGPYGDAINRGIDFVLDSQQDNGMLVGGTKMRGGMYSHSISTLLLSEVSGMVDPERQDRIRAALPRAFEVILTAQRLEKRNNHQGGWRYNNSSRDSDISCTGWPLIALRSARNNGAAVPVEAIESGVQFILNCRHQSGGFAYQPGQGPGFARTGVALLSLELCGHHDSEEARGAAKWILDHPPRVGRGWFYYGLYYSAQGMYQLGEEYWEPFARRMYRIMLEAQRQDGSWPGNGDGGNRAGPCYTTAMSVLALSVPCCQLPIYQR
ncbi:MAG: prenyltransferase/squalene oxidase repeat-containing protein [Candidatus Brocadiia bacterium]